jgi:hypothetical protein
VLAIGVLGSVARNPGEWSDLDLDIVTTNELGSAWDAVQLAAQGLDSCKGWRPIVSTADGL